MTTRYSSRFPANAARLPPSTPFFVSPATSSVPLTSRVAVSDTLRSPSSSISSLLRSSVNVTESQSGNRPPSSEEN
ncbi:MAG: hypothetical protein GEV07_07965 [Streptosporangiales bacterium]|nr:hypothetical protein [Streptosporangiales bacterium]